MPQIIVHDRNSGSGFVVVGPAVVFVLVSALLLSVGRTEYPQLHMVLDTGAWLLSCMLAISLCDLGSRTNQSSLTWLGTSFAVTSLLELVHVATTVEWSGRIASFVQLHDWLRPSTWPPAAYVLPIGAVGSIWLARGTLRQALTMTSILMLLGATLLTLFYFLPRYSPLKMNLLDQTTRAIGNRQDLPSIFRVVLSSLEDHLPIDFGCMCLCEPQRPTLTVTCVGPRRFRSRSAIPVLV